MFIKKLNFMVREYDVMTNDNIKPSAILDFFQNIASIHAQELNVGFNDLLDKELYWVVLYTTFEYVNKPLSFGDNIVVSTWPKEKYKLEFEREYEINDTNNNLIIKGISNWCIINSKTRRLERADKLDFNYKENKTNYNEKCKRHLGLIPNNILMEYDYKILKTDLDHNMHMNNARYLDIIYNMRTDIDNFNFKKVEIAFIHEVMLNQIVHVKYFKDNNIDYYCGYVDDVLCFEISMVMED